MAVERNLKCGMLESRIWLLVAWIKEPDNDN